MVWGSWVGMHKHVDLIHYAYVVPVSYKSIVHHAQLSFLLHFNNFKNATHYQVNNSRIESYKIMSSLLRIE